MAVQMDGWISGLMGREMNDGWLEGKDWLGRWMDKCTSGWVDGGGMNQAGRESHLGAPVGLGASSTF